MNLTAKGSPKALSGPVSCSRVDSSLDQLKKASVSFHPILSALLTILALSKFASYPPHSTQGIKGQSLFSSMELGGTLAAPGNQGSSLLYLPVLKAP